MKKSSYSMVVLFVLLITSISCTADSVTGESTVKNIDTAGLLELQKQGAIIIDVRTPEEWNKTGVIPGAKRVMFMNQQIQPVENEFLKQINQIAGNSDKPVVLYCHSGGRSTRAAKLLAERNFRSTIYNLDNGIQQWLSEGKPTVEY